MIETLATISSYIVGAGGVVGVVGGLAMIVRLERRRQAMAD